MHIWGVLEHPVVFFLRSFGIPGSSGYNTPTYFEGFLAGIDKFVYKKINTTARIYPGYLELNSSKNLKIQKK
jgi:hypothetical protein